MGSKKGRIEKALLVEIADLRATGDMPTTGRFLYYRLVANGTVEKGRRGAIDSNNVLKELRDAGVVEMDEIVDRSRGALDYRGWPSVAERAAAVIQQAKLDIWEDDAPLLVVESDSLAGLLQSMAAEFRVILVALRGQASTGLLGAELPGYVENETAVLYLGDWDRSGGDIERSARERIEAYAGVELDWQRIALTEEQVHEYDLPIIMKKDGRDKKVREAVETEALDQRILIPLVRAALEERLPQPLAEIHAEEERQRAALLARLA